MDPGVLASGSESFSGTLDRPGYFLSRAENSRWQTVAWDDALEKADSRLIWKMKVGECLSVSCVQILLNQTFPHLSLDPILWLSFICREWRVQVLFIGVLPLKNFSTQDEQGLRAVVMDLVRVVSPKVY